MYPKPEQVYTPDIKCVCEECGITDVKMWRESYVIVERVKTYCYTCVEEITGKRINLSLCDQVGPYVPAVPTNDGSNSYWGYSSVPDDGCWWWKLLPVNDMTGIILDMEAEIESLQDVIADYEEDFEDLRRAGYI